MKKINKKEIAMLTGFAVAFVLIVVLYLQTRPKAVQNVPPYITPAVSPTSGGFKESAYEKLVPGKSTEEEAKKLFGEPGRIEEKNGNKYFIYPTRVEGFDNVLAFKNSTLIYLYSVENFFGDFKKTPNDFTILYGTPDLVLYEKNDDVLEWRVYSSKGVAIAVSPFENVIIKVAYFPPQSKEEFKNNFLEELQLTEKKEISPDEQL